MCTILSLSLEHASCFEFKLIGNISLQVIDPCFMAAKELAIFSIVGGKTIEACSAVAFLISLNVLGHVISNERAKQVQLEVVFLVEVLASGCLMVGVVITLVALVSKSNHEFLLALEAKFSQNSLLEIHADAIDGISNLHQGLGWNFPRSS